MICTLGIFFRFHVKLVFQNMTTLEHMDRKRDSLIKNDMPNVKPCNNINISILIV